jgi:hypothetical protein
MEEIIEGSEEDGSILDIVDGEDGETVYVEVTEEARAEIVQKVSTMASDRVRAVLLILSADPPESVYDASASPQGGTSQHQRSAPNTQATAAPAGNATSSCS